MPAHSLADWLAHLESLHPRGEHGIELGLERIRRVAQALGQRQRCPVITVTGTNGKGSTCAMLDSILRAAGYRVGLYTSPHLLRYNERVRINGEAVADDLLCAAFARVEDARAGVPLTYFEFGTLAAWEIFSMHDLSAIVLEVGLGGRLDATNLYDADCAVLTTVGLDHMQYLGPTRAAIGFEKAGIGRPGRPFICGDLDPPASVFEVCARIGSDLHIIGRDFGVESAGGQWRYWNRRGRLLAGLAAPALRGVGQLANAACAIAALDALRDRLPVSAQEIRRGLATVSLPGRCQVWPGRPEIVLDVAHNPQAVQALARNLAEMRPAARTWGICGMMADKDSEAVVSAMKAVIDDWLPCDLPTTRAAAAAQLAALIAKVGAGRTAGTFASPAAALEQARADAGADDRIVIFGSFLTVAGALRLLERSR